MDSVQVKMSWHSFLVFLGWYQVNYVHSILEVILPTQDLYKVDKLGKIWNGSAASLVSMMKMRTIGLVTCLTSIAGSHWIYQLIAQYMATYWASILWSNEAYHSKNLCGYICQHYNVYLIISILMMIIGCTVCKVNFICFSMIF